METEIFNSLLYIVNFFNNPQNDQSLLKKVGIKNEPNLLPIVVRVGMVPFISIGELASQLGKSHSATSRQVDKFESQGLLKTNYDSHDKRIRIVSLSAQGQEIFQLISKTRLEILSNVLGSLSNDEVNMITSGLNTLTKVLKELDSD